MTDRDILKDAQESFKAAAEAESHNRSAAREDVRFARLGEQWPEKVRAERERDGRPCLTINRLPAFVRQVVNDARQNKPMISVGAVDSQADPKTAEILGGMIRHIERNSDADIAYDTAIEWAAYSGLGYWSIDADYASDDGFEQELFIRREQNPFAIYGDPDSESATSDDWQRAHKLHTLSLAEFKAKYKGEDPVSFGADEDASREDTEGKLVQLSRYWTVTREDKKLVLLSNGGAILEDELKGERLALMQAEGIVPTERSRPIQQSRVNYYICSGKAVLDKGTWAGRYIPIVPVYGDEVFVDGKRYFRSLIRDALDAQRMFNYWRTISTELVALAPRAPWIGVKGQFKTDAKKWRTAHSQNWPYIEYDPVPGEPPPQRQPFAGPPAGALQEALNASDDMKAIMGIYDASLGARSNETSGRAIMARQREGDVSTFHLMDNRNRSIRHTGRILIDLIPKIYSTERVIRVLGKDETSEQVVINQERPDPQTGEIQKAFDITVGRYDVAVKAGPSFTTQREEAAAQMTELVRAFPDAAPVIGDLIAKNLDWPGADEIAQRLQMLQQNMAQANQPAPIQQDPNKQIELQIKQLDVEIARINAQTKQIEAQVRLAEAESKRAQAAAQALAPPMPPQAA